MTDARPLRGVVLYIGSWCGISGRVAFLSLVSYGRRDSTAAADWLVCRERGMANVVSRGGKQGCIGS